MEVRWKRLKRESFVKSYEAGEVKLRSAKGFVHKQRSFFLHTEAVSYRKDQPLILSLIFCGAEDLGWAQRRTWVSPAWWDQLMELRSFQPQECMKAEGRVLVHPPLGISWWSSCCMGQMLWSILKGFFLKSHQLEYFESFRFNDPLVIAGQGTIGKACQAGKVFFLWRLRAIGAFNERKTSWSQHLRFCSFQYPPILSISVDSTKPCLLILLDVAR